MVRTSKREPSSERERASGGESSGSDGKVLLNRRNYVKAGASTVALLSISSTASTASDTTADENLYWTDFSDGPL